MDCLRSFFLQRFLLKMSGSKIGIVGFYGIHSRRDSDRSGSDQIDLGLYNPMENTINGRATPMLVKIRVRIIARGFAWVIYLL